MPSSVQSKFLACLMLLFVAIALLAGPPAQAGLTWESDGGQQTSPALATHYSSDVRGLLVETTINQRFVNASSDWLEGVYTIPLPEGAALHGLTLRIGERLIEGEVQLRQDARVTYEAAKLEGRKTALVENQQGNLFRTRVAEVGPGESVEVELRLSHEVRFEQGRFELVLPLSLVPRFGAAPNLDGAFSQLDVAAAEHGEAPRATVELWIDAGVPVQRPYSRTHGLKVTGSGTQYEVSSGSVPIVANRDLVLRWEPRPADAPSAAMFAQEVAGEQYALVMLVPPSDPGPRLPRELILILDTSGSMQGVSLAAAKSAARLALGGLTAIDRFNLIRFSSNHEQLFAQSLPPSADNLAQALGFIEAMRASGGTLMAPALASAFALPDDTERVRQVVFVTDGAVSNEDQVSAQVSSDAGSARVFAVGIGSAPNAHFLRKAAELGRGSALMVRDPAEAEVRMGELLQQLNSPLLTRLSIHSEVPVQTLPAVLPDLYAGQSLMIMLRGKQLTGKLRVEGLRQGATWQRELPLRVRQDDGVARLYGRRLIGSLEDELRLGGDESELRPQIEATALSFGLASRYTSFVAVDRTPARDPDGPSRKVAFGNARAVDVQAFAVTATSWPLTFFCGLLACLLALVGLAPWRS